MAGKIWEVPLPAYGRVWLIECELARHLRRRVLLAVDKSDSTAGAADSLESVTTELARTLDPGDTVALWVMGEAAPQREFEIRNESARLDLVQSVRSLKGSQRGSWLRETWGGIRALAAQPKPGFRDFPVVISDGEVFDAGADLQALGAPLRWLPLRGGAGDPTEDFVHAVTETAATPEELKKALACPPASARLHVRSSGVSRAVAFDQNGALGLEWAPGELDGVPTQRLMLLGGKLESVYVAYSAGPAAWRDDAFEPVPVKWPAEAHLQAALRALTGVSVRWDKSRLAMLADGRATSFECPWDGMVSQPGHLACIRCGSFLLALEPMELDGIHPLRWKFPLMADGGVGDPLEADGEDTGDLPWAVTNDAQGRWLVLNLGGA